MTNDLLLERTAEVLAGFTPAGLDPIEKGGSSRYFFRIRDARGGSAILVRDLGEKEENKHYASLAGFLSGHGVPVPRVLAESRGEGLLWLEDLGEQDLWAARNEPWEMRRPLYESVLRGIALLHRIPYGEGEGDVAGLHLQPPFDERLYRWEQEYFAAHCLGDLFGIARDVRDGLLESASMKRLACGLAARPRQLVHRDFQSQNILIRDGEASFIDFQGMRPGLAQYDLASLLRDPYVTLAPEERDHLLGYYQGIAPSGDPEEFGRVFWQCAAQRLMQALGAYGFLSIHRGKPAFRAHVVPALANLREALTHLHPEDRLDEISDLIKDLKTSPTPGS